MIEELKEISLSLEKLSKDIDIQLSATVNDSKQFHEQLINLLSKFPDDKEIIQFIVFINDRIVTNHEISKDILYDAVKSIINQKQYLIKRLIREYENNNKNESKFVKAIEVIKANKTVLIVISSALAISLLFGSILMKPTETVESLKIIKGFTK